MREKCFNFYFRVTGLLRSGQMKWKERPLWYDVYVANPPQTELSADASLPIRKLYYKEDIAMARFYKQFRSVGAISISNEESESLCKKFIDLYKTIEEKWPELSEDEHYKKTLMVLNKKLSLQKRRISVQKPFI
ncbi:unnamed protein product [Onchocerca flexuosa]|uniref:Small ribosomal subunit protein mS23 n=1 Tax=Onchocerca flexuosa TaxID=387005 RepID=A0A183I0Y7_9BILA|nr:unnamed protein product [Onchocerca flexuosa]